LSAYWMSKHWEQWFSGLTAAPGPGQLLEGERSAGQQCLADGQIRVTELVLAQPDHDRNGGKISAGQRVFQVTTAPLLDGTGKVNQVVELAQEITQQKQTQAQMIRAGKLAAVGQLAGQVAHEVNNPIAILSAKARLLLTDRRSEMSPKIAQELGKITELADRVARIAQGLLSYCRPSATTRRLLDVRQPLRKSLAMIEQPARQRGVKIEEHFTDSVPAVEANAAELEQIFLNLFLNALDAMPQGGTLEVSIATQALLPGGHAALSITVRDTGTGIPAELRERIFEPFFTTKQEGRGTGLGLSICQGLVRSHGGEIEVQSEPGQGTRFLVKFPVTGESQEKKPHA
jgi:signal transduction histidine kinase